MTLVTAGRVGKAHGRDGSFYVEAPQIEFAEGGRVRLGDAEEAGESRALPDALASGDGVFGMAPSAGGEHGADQEPHEEQGEIREHVPSGPVTGTIRIAGTAPTRIPW